MSVVHSVVEGCEGQEVTSRGTAPVGMPTATPATGNVAWCVVEPQTGRAQRTWQFCTPSTKSFTWDTYFTFRDLTSPYIDRQRASRVRTLWGKTSRRRSSFLAKE